MADAFGSTLTYNQCTRGAGEPAIYAEELAEPDPFHGCANKWEVT
jgi:hypothetical protein